MKAEERHSLEENSLLRWLKEGWAAITSGSTGNTVLWGLIVLGLISFIGWRAYSRNQAEARSDAWADFDLASTSEQLEEIAKTHPNTVPARMAKFNLSRFQLQDACTRVAGPNREDRNKAADTLEAVKKRYLELARESADEPSLAQESLMNAAKAEETLCGIPRADDATKSRGSLDEALKIYDDLAKRYPKSFLGEQAAKRSREINGRRSAFDGFYIALLKEIAPPLPPAVPLPGTPALPVPETSKTPEAGKVEIPAPAMPKAVEPAKTETPPTPKAEEPKAKN